MQIMLRKQYEKVLQSDDSENVNTLTSLHSPLHRRPSSASYSLCARAATWASTRCWASSPSPAAFVHRRRSSIHRFGFGSDRNDALTNDALTKWIEDDRNGGKTWDRHGPTCGSPRVPIARSRSRGSPRALESRSSRDRCSAWGSCCTCPRHP